MSRRIESDTRQSTGAENLLVGLKRAGIDYIFANAGTDFPPIIEAFAALDHDDIPVPLTIPHETASTAMAHGYYLVTGKAQATMVHVNVGLANSAMGVINAASDNVPLLVLSGRTPITESGRKGSRLTPIQYGQEMYDQASLVKDVTKFHYEMRYPEQGGSLAMRAATLANSDPKGPVYLSLPREALMDVTPATAAHAVSHQGASSAAFPDPEAIATAAEWLSAARNPLVICQRGDPEGRTAASLARLAEDFAIGVVEPFVVRNVMPSQHPMFLGYDVKGPLAEADVVVVLDSGVPWIEALHRPDRSKKIIHIGPDPQFARMPVRGYQADLAITSAPAPALDALARKMKVAADVVTARRASLIKASEARRHASAEAAQRGATDPMTDVWMSKCISDAMDDRAVVFSELGVVPGAMTVSGANRIFTNPHSGGLGWAFPAALGAQLADRERLCIACVGDGSYMFANPVACHQIAEAMKLPVLVIIKNNRMWNAVRRAVVGAYPDGAAVKANRVPLTSLEPAPDYAQVAAASRAYTETVERGQDLPAALARAIDIIRTEKRQALLNVMVVVSDR